MVAIKNKSVHPYNKMNLFKIGKTDTKLYCSCQSNEENVASVLGRTPAYMSKL